MTLRRSARLPFLATLMALSGACALVYQIAWLREFRLVFGGATPAAAAVLAIFMGGLGAGSAWFGRRVERVANPLRLYAFIEIGVGVSALLTPFFLGAVQSLYAKTGGVVALGLVKATLLQLLLATVVLALPCILMGGSLPAAFKWAETDADRQRGTLGVLYGVNTLGAVAGVVVSTFWLLELWGIRATVTAAAIVNVAIGAAAWFVSQTSEDAHALQQPAIEAIAAKAPPVFVYIAAGLTGFTFILSELVWFRMMAPLVGSSVYGFGLILAVALAGIGVGGLLYRVAIASRPGSVSLGAFALLTAGQALFLAVPWALGDRIAVLAIDMSHSGALGLLGHALDWTALTSLMVAGPALMAGVLFPMLVGLLGEGAYDGARHTGNVYAANTLGSITGSLAGGFVLVPALSAPGCWRLVTFLTMALSGGALFLTARSISPRRLYGTEALLVLAGSLILLCAGPSAVWRHQPIGYGRVEPLRTSVNERRYQLDNVRLSIPYQFEGRESSVAISSGDTGWSFFVNGKSDGAAFGDANTQVMLGLLPAMLHPEPRTAFVVGLGTGSTAGWLADVPGMTRVDVAELEPGMAQLARTYFAPVNRDVMTKPNVNLIVGDARETLFVAGPKYDLIVSEPSNPYRAGVATLFTREYYQAVQSRLAAGGLFAQWLQSYEVDARAVELVYATLAAVFPHLETWSTGRGDLLLIGHSTPPSYSLSHLRSRVGQAPFSEALLRVWLTQSAEGILAHHFASPAVATEIAQSAQTPNTDDRNQLEYGFARALAEQASFEVGQLLSKAMTANADLPAHLVKEVDRSRVSLERLLGWAAEGIASKDLPGLQGDDASRAKAILAFVEQRFPDVLTSWVGPLANPMEQLMWANAAAAAGTPTQVETGLQQLESAWPADAHFIAAESALRLGGSQEAAVDQLRQGFTALRTQAWTRPRNVEAGLVMVARLVPGNPTRAQIFLEVLRDPFPGGLAEPNRLKALAEVGSNLPSRMQVFVASMFEPYPVWTRGFLEFRAKAYRSAGDARSALAAKDLGTFDRYASR